MRPNSSRSVRYIIRRLRSWESPPGSGSIQVSIDTHGNAVHDGLNQPVRFAAALGDLLLVAKEGK